VTKRAQPSPRGAARASRSGNAVHAPSLATRLVAIVSDIHFDCHDPAAWRAFRLWHAANRPAETVVLGDFVDLGMMSRYRQGDDDPLNAIEQVKVFVREANALAAECGRLTVIEGNHDERWGRLVEAFQAGALKGAIGLTLREQCVAQGLSADVRWIRESAKTPPLRLGGFTLRHGHRQVGRFGGPVHIAANRVNKNLGASEVVGHHHRAQLFARSAGGRTAVVIANPCMTGDHEYAPDADWQRGFTILETFGEGHGLATAYPIVMHDGAFAWAGRLYDGRASIRAEAARAPSKPPKAKPVERTTKRTKAPAAPARKPSKKTPKPVAKKARR
jgi:predicted phosphodiesterase